MLACLLGVFSSKSYNCQVTPLHETLLPNKPSNSSSLRVAEMALLGITTPAFIIFVICLVSLWVWKEGRRRGRLPPGPTPLPIIGNLMQLNLKDLPASLCKVRGFRSGAAHLQERGSSSPPGSAPQTTAGWLSYLSLSSFDSPPRHFGLSTSYYKSHILFPSGRDTCKQGVRCADQKYRLGFSV